MPINLCRVRHDCPEDLEDEEAVTEVISIVGAAPDEGDELIGGPCRGPRSRQRNS